MYKSPGSRRAPGEPDFIPGRASRPPGPMGDEIDRTWEALKGLPMGQRVELTEASGRRWSGFVIPPSEFSAERVIVLKLSSGYNVGVRIEPGVTFRILEGLHHEVAHGQAPPRSEPVGPRDAVTLLTTGGTIASRVDYETGGVRPVRDEREILEFFPEIARSGPVRIVPVFDKMSEDIDPNDWMRLAEKVVEAFAAGARGVVIAHGTDTLGFTAAALSFLLTDLPGAVVLVGAQRSPDRPSSDGPSNLGAACAVARDRRVGEVVVVMHEGLSDTRFSIHRGTRVRKMHSSRRDAFQSRNGPPLGTVEDDRISFESPPRPPSAGPPVADGPIDARAGLLWSFPGLTEAQARRFSDGLRGVVLAGTGLGHVPASLLPWVRSATESGVVVAMTTQCLEGTTNPHVYATGRELVRAGAVYLDDLLPETAYAKLVWALGHESTVEGVRRRLLEDRAGEFSPRHRAEVRA